MTKNKFWIPVVEVYEVELPPETVDPEAAANKLSVEAVKEQGRVIDSYVDYAEIADAELFEPSI